jgi:hypothetical protein
MELKHRFSQKFRVLAAKSAIRVLHWCGLYDGFFSAWRWALFDFAEKHGLHILPVHYYTPIPDLAATKFDEHTERFLACDDQTLASALGFLVDLREQYGREFDEIASRKPRKPRRGPERFEFGGGAPYSTVEAELLYGLIRTRKPKRIVEVGCGHTTFLIAEAIAAEGQAGYHPVYSCIEPFRPAYLSNPPKEVSDFIEKPLQDIDLSFFSTLEAGDILFIDSSHVVKYGSDTVYELLELLSSLADGVLVHFHDIFLPYDYPTDWLQKGRFFWSEQYMLNALLNGQEKFRTIFPLHQIYRQRREELEKIFPLLSDGDHRPAAYWLEVCHPSAPRPRH